MNNSSKQYHAPQCRRLGTVQELTQAGGSPNADTPQGVNNTAFPPAS
jgi:hypothetical protein